MLTHRKKRIVTRDAVSRYIIKLGESSANLGIMDRCSAARSALLPWFEHCRQLEILFFEVASWYETGGLKCSTEIKAQIERGEDNSVNGNFNIAET